MKKSSELETVDMDLEYLLCEEFKKISPTNKKHFFKCSCMNILKKFRKNYTKAKEVPVDEKIIYFHKLFKEIKKCYLCQKIIRYHLYLKS